MFSVRRRLLFAFWGAIGFFLFILFFQPFGIEATNINSYILLIAGFGGIAFIIYLTIHLSVPWNKLSLKIGPYNLNIMFVFEMLVWILNTVAFSFYLRYVGKVNLSIFLVVRIALLTVFQLAINMIIYELNDLRIKLSSDHNEAHPHHSTKKKGEKIEKHLTFISITGAEKLKLNLRQLILVKAAENYVEFCYRDGNDTRKKLLRTTLRSIDDQLKNYPSFIRCHRNSIINIDFVEHLNKASGASNIKLKYYPEEVPVSRQYILQVKETVENRD